MMAKGSHQIKVILKKRDARLRPPLAIEHVDVHVSYQP